MGRECHGREKWSWSSIESWRSEAPWGLWGGYSGALKPFPWSKRPPEASVTSQKGRNWCIKVPKKEARIRKINRFPDSQTAVVASMDELKISRPPAVLHQCTADFGLAYRTVLPKLWDELSIEEKKPVWFSHAFARLFLRRSEQLNAALDRARLHDIAPFARRCT